MGEVAGEFQTSWRFAGDAPDSLEGPSVSVLTLVGLQLPPLAEVPPAAFKVALEARHKAAAANHTSVQDSEEERTSTG